VPNATAASIVATAPAWWYPGTAVSEHNLNNFGQLTGDGRPERLAGVPAVAQPSRFG
jgi:hypothetical protein